MPAKLGTMSEPVTGIEAGMLLLPPVVVPPLMSFAAPVVMVVDMVPGVVGVPLTVQVITPPMATVAAVGTVGEHVAVKPAGKAPMAQVAPMLAAAVAAGAVLVQVKLPVYGMPTWAAGRLTMAGTMSEPVITIAVITIELVAVLLPLVVVPPLVSFAAPVVSVKAAVPAAVGVPLTVQVIAAPMARVAVVGTAGLHTLVKPAGKPAIAQVAPMLAAAAAVALLVQV
jgi:hypothetical protein